MVSKVSWLRHRNITVPSRHFGPCNRILRVTMVTRVQRILCVPDLTPECLRHSRAVKTSSSVQKGRLAQYSHPTGMR